MVIPEPSQLGVLETLKPCPVPLEVMTEERVATPLMSLTLGPQAGLCRWDGAAAKGPGCPLQETVRARIAPAAMASPRQGGVCLHVPRTYN